MPLIELIVEFALAGVEQCSKTCNMLTLERCSLNLIGDNPIGSLRGFVGLQSRAVPLFGFSLGRRNQCVGRRRRKVDGCLCSDQNKRAQ